MQDNIITTKKNGGGFYETASSGNKKKILVAVAVVAALAFFLGGYIFWKNAKNRQSSIDTTNQEAAQEATKGVLPSLSSNPLEDKPNLNPVDNTNPIKEIKTNPFE